MRDYESQCREDRDARSMCFQTKSASLFDRAVLENTEVDVIDRVFYFEQLGDFIEYILAHDGDLIQRKVGRRREVRFEANSRVHHYFKMISDFVKVVEGLNPLLEFDELTNAFCRCCEALGLLNNHDGFWSTAWRQPTLNPFHPDTSGCVEFFNTLVEGVRVECRKTSALAKYKARRTEAGRMAADYGSYMDALFERYSRLVVLRVDFLYQKKFSDSITIAEVADDLAHFQENRRCNKILRFMVGFVTKIEYGIEKGLHVHVIMLFDGSRRDGRKHVQLAMQIGEYWKEVVTKGRGDYWNVNAKIEDFKRLNRCGIGLFNASDTDLRENLKKYVVGYLCKSSQYVRFKDREKTRLIRRGVLPKKRLVKLGRPRAQGQVLEERRALRT